MRSENKMFYNPIPTSFTYWIVLALIRTPTIYIEALENDNFNFKLCEQTTDVPRYVYNGRIGSNNFIILSVIGNILGLALVWNELHISNFFYTILQYNVKYQSYYESWYIISTCNDIYQASLNEVCRASFSQHPW